MKPTFPLTAAIVFCLFSHALPANDAAPARHGLAGPFFAMDTGTRDAQHQTPQAQAELLKELGYAGFSSGDLGGLPAMLKALDDKGLKMFALYVGAAIDPDQPKYEPRLKEAIETLKGRDAIIWLYVTSKKHKPSSPEGDGQAVEVIREIAGLAGQSGLRVALYPHTGCWVESVSDAVRVAKKVDRKNVGATFNLCHSLKVDGEKNLKPLLESAMPHLFVVTINGADRDGQNWDTLIQTLDRGSFDVYELLRTLKHKGYRGPIGLQHYGIKGDAHENLKRSMDAWQKFSARMAAE